MFDCVGERIRGFTVTRVRENAELGGRLVEMTFEKTGTQLCWVDNGLENKLFSIAFKTLPEDSTGVFHILEHSVLCGSAKYPVREPFVELLKSSMNTFLNAMTFSDKTMYPVSSRNEQDFLNLTEVYLDAVFAPRILSDPNIFYQEGWHIEQGEEGLSYKGVVFNEMKGAMSGADRLLSQKLIELLFPDSCYGFNSGGDPAVIPDLRYRQFTDTYRRFYHPSNARIFLDGAVPMERTLALLEEYLSPFEKQTALPTIALQTPVRREETIDYELSREESAENKGQLALGKILCTWQDRATILAMRVLKDVLAGSNEAPLKRAVLSAGLAQDMTMDIDDSIAQPYLEIQLKNIADGKDGELLALIRETGRTLAEQGVDRAALEASVNRLEFRLKEPEEPQGLERCIEAMNSWLHDGDPMQYLVYEADLAAVRAMIETGGFNALLRRMLVEEDGLAVVHARASYTRGEELRREESARLAAVEQSWTAADREENASLGRALQAWQQMPDTAEQLAKLPVLDLSQVSEQPELAETALSRCQDVTVLFHPVHAPGVIHLSLYFALTDFSLEELSLLGTMGSFFGKLPTERYGTLELQQALKNTVGRLEFSLESFSRQGQTEKCTPCLAVRCSLLRQNLAKAEDLILEVLQKTDFTRRDKLRELLIQLDERRKLAGVQAGHALAMMNVMSRYSAAGAVGDAVAGYSGIRALRDLTAHFEDRAESFIALFQKLQRQSACRTRLTVSVTAGEPVDLSGLLSRLPQGTPVPDSRAYAVSLPERMGCPIPAMIGFTAQGSHLERLNARRDGCLAVAANLIGLGYLWNEVRVQGGAYGTGLSVGADGGVFTYSYRDPSPARSLDVNKGIADYLRAFCAGDERLDKYIISTVAREDPLRSPREQGAFADRMWLCGYTQEDLIARRREMLAATREKLLESCRVWESFAREGAVSVVGFEDLLSDCGGLERREL